MIFIARRKVVVAVFFVILAISALIISGKQNTPVFSGKVTHCIIIDAGHGFPDGGAIGMNGSIESTLNLKIALFTEKLLSDKGYKVIMTRSSDDALTKEGKTVANRKRNDMYKRLDIINSSCADMFVSIHMNKYTDSRYKGAQTLYSGNFTQSQLLAETIQEEFHKIKENESKRTPLKAPDGLFLLKNARIPAVIAECGFLSNFEEERLLNTENYQKAIAGAIAKGIEKYYFSMERSNQNNESFRNR